MGRLHRAQPTTPKMLEGWEGRIRLPWQTVSWFHHCTTAQPRTNGQKPQRVSGEPYFNLPILRLLVQF